MNYKILFFSILLIGCKVEYEPIELECENNTIIINNTINKTITNTIIEIEYINKTCNVTCECIEYEYEGTTSRELELIRRIKFLEGQQDKFINDSDCNDDLNKTENKLIDCEDELCKINSSWC